MKPAVAAVARMLGIRVIGQASESGELEVLCKTRGEHGALERIVLELRITALPMAKCTLPTVITRKLPSA